MPKLCQLSRNKKKKNVTSHIHEHKQIAFFVTISHFVMRRGWIRLPCTLILWISVWGEKKHKKKEKDIRDQHGSFALETGTWFAVASYILTNMMDMKNPWMDVGDSDNVYESLMPLWERTCFFCSRGMCVPCMGRKARGDNILSSTTSQQCDSWLKATQSTGTNQ